jgi:type VI secretion system protein
MKRLAALLCAVMLAAGCSVIPGFGPKAVKPGWKTLTLVAAPDANANSALAVDVVLVKDKTLLEGLLAMPAARYFTAKAGLQRTFPEGLTVLSVEITPGQTIKIEPSRFKGEKAWAALAFANYATPGEHRESLLLDQRAYVLQLDAQEFAATGPAPARPR